MDTVSAVIIGLMLFFTLRGALRGLNGELAPLAGLLLAAGVLWFGQPQLHAAVSHFWPTADGSARAFYTALVAIGVAIACFFLTAFLLRRIIRTLFPQPFNAILGALVGAAKAFLIISVAGGAVSVARDRFEGLRRETESNPIASAAAGFWAKRFESVASDCLTRLPHSTESEPHGWD